MKLIYQLGLLGSCLLLLLACESEKRSSSSPKTQSLSELVDSSEESSVSFTITPTALLKQSLTASANQRNEVAFEATDVFDGVLNVTHADTSELTPFDWSVALNDTTFEAESLKSIILEPDTYHFELIVSRGSQQYAAEALSQTLTNGINDIALTLSPIIGDTLIDAHLTERLTNFQFQYDPNELSLASFSNPQIGVIVNEDNEQIFTLNVGTGLSDMFLNLPEGPHTLQLKLYEASIQRGRSIVEQESVTVTAGTDISMDLIALQADIALTLTEAGHDATFDFTIPHEVVDEAGGLANLAAHYSITGDNTSLQQGSLALAFMDPDYEATVTLPDFQYDNLTISLTFEDTSLTPNAHLGSCSQTATLQSTPQTISCDLGIHRRAIVSGDLLATIGINVMDTNQQPVAGATVSANGQSIGTTGAAGHLTSFLLADNYTIRAEDTVSQMFGEQDLSLTALELSHFNLILNQPTWEGTQQFGSADADITFSIARDTDGNLYLAGWTRGDLGDQPNMGGDDLILVKYDPHGERKWTRQLGTLGQDVGLGVAVDNNGHIYVAGNTQGNLAGETNTGGHDLFLIKYNSAGDRIWTRLAGSTVSEFGRGVTVDNMGHIYITGWTQGNFDGQVNEGLDDIVVVKYDSAGSKIWTKFFGTPDTDLADEVSVDTNDNIYITGLTHGDLGSTNNLGGSDLVVIKLDSDGNEQWIQQLGSSGDDAALEAAIDSNGHVYVTGTVKGSLGSHPHEGNEDIFLIKLDGNSIDGDIIWTRQLGTSTSDLARGVAIDSQGNAYISGYTSGGLHNNPHIGGTDILLIKYNSSGDLKDVQQLGTTANEEGRELVIDPYDNIYINGHTQGGLDGNINTGDWDLFIVKYNSNGVLQ